jgi:hypothetical protein
MRFIFYTFAIVLAFATYIMALPQIDGLKIEVLKEVRNDDYLIRRHTINTSSTGQRQAQDTAWRHH